MAETGNVILQVLQGSNVILQSLPMLVSGVQSILRLIKADPGVTVQIIDVQTGAIQAADETMAMIEEWRAQG